METKRPRKESAPWLSNKSSKSPVDAEDETSRINVSGTVSVGYPNKFVSGEIKLLNMSNAPLARSIPTATISPIIDSKKKTRVFPEKWGLFKKISFVSC